MKTNTDFELWIDSLDITAIEHAKSLGILHGITTNPSILSYSSEPPLNSILHLIESFDGPLAVQVISLDSNEMVRQAKAFREISDRIIIKIPCIQKGYIAMQELNRLDIPVMATAIYTFRQYVLATMCKAKYAAPYFSRMIKLFTDEQLAIAEISKMIDYSRVRSTKVLLAAIENAFQLDALIEQGAQCATIKSEVYKEWIQDFPKTLIDLNTFEKDWSSFAKGIK